MHRALQGRCGLFCGDCDVYIAYSTDNNGEKRRIAQTCCDKIGKSLGPEQVKCLGCKGSISSPWRAKCKIRACAEERGMEFCYQCLTYPCDDILDFFESHPQARENLRQISKKGPDAWMHEMLSKSKADRESGQSSQV